MSKIMFYSSMGGMPSNMNMHSGTTSGQENSMFRSCNALHSVRMDGPEEAGSPLDLELRSCLVPLSSATHIQLRRDQWRKHGGKQLIFVQRDYFHNMCVLHEHYNMKQMLDIVAPKNQIH